MIKVKVLGRRFALQELIGYLCVSVVCLLCFTFPVTASVPFFLKFPSYHYNLGVRIVYLTLTFFLFWSSLFFIESNKISRAGWFLIIFWLLYSLRLLYDTLVLDLIIRGNIFKLYAIAFGNCFFAAIAILRTGRFVKHIAIIKGAWVSLASSCIVILVSTFYLHGSIMPADIVGRARFTVELGPGYEYNALNPITIGFHGGSLYLLSLGILLLHKLNYTSKILAIIGIVLGFWVLILGASRGPALSATIGTFLIFVTYLWFFKKSKIRILINLALLGVVSVLGYVFVLPKLAEVDFTLLRRLTSSLDKITQGEKEVRSYQWESAIKQFVENPIVGDRYLERYMNFYPHNVYLEVPMSTGIIGSAIFYTMLGLSLFYAIRLFINRDERIILFIPLFAILMWMLTSGSIFEGVALWTYLALWLSVNSSFKSSSSPKLLVS